MPVHNIFPTPVYAKQLLGSKQGEINQELYSVYDPDKMVKILIHIITYNLMQFLVMTMVICLQLIL